MNCRGLIFIFICSVLTVPCAAQEPEPEEPETPAEVTDTPAADPEAEQLAKEKEHIKGLLTQYRMGDVTRKVLAVNAVNAAFKEKKISEKTLMPFLIEAVGNPIPRVSVVAHAHLTEHSGKTVERTKEAWEKWWQEQVAAEKEKEEKSGDEELPPADIEELPETEEEMERKRLLNEGKMDLLEQHNEELGHLDILTLKNGREVECYIVMEQKDAAGEVEKYICKFKDALGTVEYLASEVEGEPEYDVDKIQDDFLLLRPVEESDEEEQP
jgi:hypothetical protein